jgi:hypothetical protein
MNRIFAAMVIATIAAVQPSLFAADGNISGTVKTRGGEVASGAQVTLVDSKRTTRTDEQGAYRFDGVAPGRHLIEVVSPRYGSAVAVMYVGDGQEVKADLGRDLGAEPGGRRPVGGGARRS